MLDKIKLKWRSFFGANQFPPKQIKLEIPGWAGDSKKYGDGNSPQPWHCLPFVEGSTYGIELIYPFETECVVKNIDGLTIFEGDFSSEEKKYNHPMPPFMSFAPGHFGFTSSFDLQPPENYIVRVEPHPKYYTDQTWTTPLPVVGHIQSEWWTKIFFVVFKQPPLGGKYVFRKGEPYAQILILPKKVCYEISEMNETEKRSRQSLEAKICKYSKNFAKTWVDDKGNNFDDKYKILSKNFAKGGDRQIENLLKESFKKEITKVYKKTKIFRIKKK